MEEGKEKTKVNTNIPEKKSSPAPPAPTTHYNWKVGWKSRWINQITHEER